MGGKYAITDLLSLERMDLAEALRESEEKYRAVVETTDTGYVILDTEGTVLAANPEYVRLTGHGTLAEILGRKVRSAVGGEVRGRGK